MKAQRRQELKTNDLSVHIDQIVRYLEQNGNKVLLFGLLLVALLAALMYSSQTRAQARLSGWQAFNEAALITPNPSDPKWVDGAIEKWDSLIATVSDPQVQTKARWQLASLCLSESVNTKEDADKKKLLEKASTQLQVLEASASRDIVLLGGVLNSLIAVEQNQFLLDRDLAHKEKAKAYLTTLESSEKFKGTPFASQARRQLAEFDSLWTLTELAPAPAVSEVTIPGVGTVPTGEPSTDKASMDQPKDQPAQAATDNDNQAQDTPPDAEPIDDETP